jgi:hypothetical protein
VRARAGEADQWTATSASNEEASRTEVETAAARWARLCKDFLDRNLGSG